MRVTEFWARMEHALGEGYARFWAESTVLADLGGRTPAQALDAGVDPKQVWHAVHAFRGLPPSER